MVMKQPAVTQLTTLSIAKKSPKWSFKGRYDTDNKQRDNPGPGAYQQHEAGATSKFHASPKYNFGTSTRGGPAEEKEVPGPGAYSLVNTIGGGTGSAAYSCTPRREELGSRKDVPGPGTHTMPGLTGAEGTPHYGFGTAERAQVSAAASPGPAAYDPPAKHGKGPTWGMGTSQRNQPDAGREAPGPGAYSLPSRTVDGPKYSAAPRREDVARTEGPGPSAYTLKSSIGDGMKFSMRARSSGAARGGEDPGPGAYDSNRSMRVTKKKGANWVFGTSTREGGTGYQAPGPGAYTPRDPVAEVCPKYGFGSSQRSGVADGRHSTPGPGTYDPGKEGRGPKFTCAARMMKKEKDAQPGPGAYEDKPSARMKAPPSWGFGTSNRNPLESSNQKAPGPGTYAHSSTLVGPGYSMQSRRALKERVKATPGPGAHGGIITQFGY